MKKDLDLYQILQVHPEAESEVIQAAYKRLSRKYHPDNQESGAEAKMKALNHAYAVLSDPEQRAKYNLQLNRPQTAEPKKEVNLETEAFEAKKVLAQYFACLACGQLDSAYQLISARDQKKISHSEYVEWQTLVGSCYEIMDYEIKYLRTTQDVKEEKTVYPLVFEFAVTIQEKDKRNVQTVSTEFSRRVVQDQDHLKVLLGYKDITAIIAKLKEEMGTVEPAEPELDRKVLIGELTKEIARAVRYKRSFAMILFEVYQGPEQPTAANGEYFSVLIRQLGERVRASDIYGHWNTNRIMVILPETRLFGAVKAAGNIFGLIKEVNQALVESNRWTFCAGVVQFKEGASLQEMIDLAVVNVLKAKTQREWAIVY